jgi:peroxiredoxin
MAIASLVLGIVALLFSLVVVGILFGFVGVALGLVHIAQKRGPNGMAWCGVVLSALGIVASLGLGVVYYRMFKVVKETIVSMAGDMSGGGGSLASDWEGVQAPDLSVTTLDGKTIQLSQLKGKRVVLDFWATWCGPCVKEIPHLVKLRNETSQDDLVMIGISQEAPVILKPFVSQKGLNYPIASAKELPAPYQDVHSIPTTFFIDRKGVIQSVAVGYHEFAQLKELAMAKDFEGQAKSAPAPPTPASELTDSDKMLKPNAGWSKSIPGAQALCTGDWDGDGTDRILVADAAGKLHVLGVDGVEKSVVMLPGKFTAIECSHAQQKGLRLLGYSNWSHKVSVMDKTGKELWSYSATLGVDGAHWGDLDGDGTDELIVGMNGFGGLHAVSADGKELWHTPLANVWSQAVIPASGGMSAMVFATEAGGSVRVFDGAGKPLRTLRPSGKYCAQMNAAVMGSANTVQGIAEGQGSVIAFDANGHVVWQAPSSNSGLGPTSAAFACGDIAGDGVREWAFLDAAGDLVLATSSGEKRAAVTGQSGVSRFVIVPDGTGRGLLITLRPSTLQAYSFQ